jgi:asparagine synthase (glutamine-hydrolysing)
MGELAAVVRLDRSSLVADDEEFVVRALGSPDDSRRRVGFGNQSAVLAAALGSADDPSGLSSPTAAEARGVWIALDGRIDNRAELIDQLTDWALVSREPADVDLLLAGYEKWGEGVFDRIVGPFASVVFDSRQDSVRLARDPLGGRELYFRQQGATVIASSRLNALLFQRFSPVHLDESSIVRYFAIAGPQPGATFFKEIEEVQPGQLVLLRESSRKVRQVAILRPAAEPGRGKDSDYKERFRELLDLAVTCRLPSVGCSATMMSGGLDSTAIAATAARVFAGRMDSPPITISWVFDELKESDETRWIEAMERSTGLRSIRFAGDDCWPLADEPRWPRFPDSPFLDLYRLLTERTAQIARLQGCSVLLTGHSADDLWIGGKDWLRSFLAQGHVFAALASLARATGLRALGHRLQYGPRAAVARLRPRSSAPPVEKAHPWLTPWAQAQLASAGIGQGEPLPASAGSWRAEHLLSPYSLAALSLARREGAAQGLEIRFPFRDRRMVEFFLGAPADLLYRPGETKRVLRRALTDRLPPEILNRRSLTTLIPLGRRGLGDRALPVVRAMLDGPDVIWPRYVRREWIRDEALNAFNQPGSGRASLVLWHCFTLERWRRTVAGHLATS